MKNLTTVTTCVKCRQPIIVIRKAINEVYVPTLCTICAKREISTHAEEVHNYDGGLKPMVVGVRIGSLSNYFVPEIADLIDTAARVQGCIKCGKLTPHMYCLNCAPDF